MSDDQIVVDELMTDEDFVKAIEEMNGEGDGDIGELLKAMNENRIISWDEAERILQDSDTGPVKSSLPEQTRPTEPDNDTDVEKCIQRLLDNDETLKEINLNNMKRTPIPQIKRLVEALAYNEYCERLSLANMGLYDGDMLMLITVVEMNSALKKINLETNYLSGDYFAKLFKAALNNMSLEEIKAVNQGVSFATTAEKEIIDAIVANKGLTKVSINLRLPEGRHKIENATLRNGEYRRILRREAAAKAKYEAEELAKNPVPKLPKEPKAAKPRPPVLPSCLANPTISSAAKEKAKIESPLAKKPPAILGDNQPLRKVTPKTSEDAKKTPVSKTTPRRKPSIQPEEDTENAPAAAAPKRTPAIARRASNADQSSTPVLNIASAPPKTAPKKKEVLSGTVPREPVKKAAGTKSASITDDTKKTPVKKKAVDKDVDDTAKTPTSRTGAEEMNVEETKKTPLKKAAAVKKLDETTTNKEEKLPVTKKTPAKASVENSQILEDTKKTPVKKTVAAKKEDDTKKTPAKSGTDDSATSDLTKKTPVKNKIAAKKEDDTKKTSADDMKTEEGTSKTLVKKTPAVKNKMETEKAPAKDTDEKQSDKTTDETKKTPLKKKVAVTKKASTKEVESEPSKDTKKTPAVKTDEVGEEEKPKLKKKIVKKKVVPKMEEDAQS